MQKPTLAALGKRPESLINNATEIHDKIAYNKSYSELWLLENVRACCCCCFFFLFLFHFWESRALESDRCTCVTDRELLEW